jgi:uncharacterized protein
VLYGEHGLIAIEVKKSRTVTAKDVSSLKSFREDYPAADLVLLYGGTERLQMGPVSVIPVGDAVVSRWSAVGWGVAYAVAVEIAAGGG